jgi:hypothetical protein
MVIFLSQIIKQLYSKNNLEEKTVSLNGYFDYAVLHMHKQKITCCPFYSFLHLQVLLSRWAPPSRSNVTILHLLVYRWPILIYCSGKKWDFKIFRFPPYKINVFPLKPLT